MTTLNLTNVFDNGKLGDHHWTIDQGADGLLYITTNADTHRLVEPTMYRGWSDEAIEEMRAGMLAEGVPAEVVATYLDQIGR